MGNEPKESKIDMYKEMISVGCCKRCALRYLDAPLEAFVDVENYLKVEDNIEKPPFKKSKSDKNTSKICIVCIGLLSDQFLDSCVADKDIYEACTYHIDSFNVTLSFPKCILIRDHSFRLFLQKKYPSLYDEELISPISRGWRWSVLHRIEKAINRPYLHTSKLVLHFNMEYSLELEEIEILKEMINEEKKVKKDQKDLSRRYVMNALTKISESQFNKFVNVPPKMPLDQIKLGNVKCQAEPIFLMGTYRKYSRYLQQVPLIENGIIVNSFCIQDLILDSIATTLWIPYEMNFYSSRFDNYTVRVLGKGRMFYVQINDPKCGPISYDKCREIEHEIKRRGYISVHDLTETTKREAQSARDAERLVPVTYKLLCIVRSGHSLQHCIHTVNATGSLDVTQKTPLCILLKVKPKHRKLKVYFLKAMKLEDKANMFILDVCTDSALKIEEFVDGDLGRTVPSISSLTGAKVEAIAVDIIHLGARGPTFDED